MKLVVLGPSGAGKTVLINRFILNTYTEHSTPTQGANFLSKTMVASDGKVVKLQLWDTVRLNYTI
jgi:GTPase SAR1 family protein